MAMELLEYWNNGFSGIKSILIQMDLIKNKMGAALLRRPKNRLKTVSYTIY
jgi:hypothetical protein